MNSRKRESAIKAYKKVCKYLNLNLSGELAKTPERVVSALAEITRYHGTNTLPFMFTTFKHTGGSNIILLDNIEFTSLCEHHHMPFVGRVHIAYIPSTKIVGLSKLPRLVDFYAGRPQTQERFTDELVKYLHKELSAKGVCVIVQATHACICTRGVRKMGVSTTTTGVAGECGIELEQKVLMMLSRR